MLAAAQVGAFSYAHDEWEHAQGSGDAAPIEAKTRQVFATKIAL